MSQESDCDGKMRAREMGRSFFISSRGRHQIVQEVIQASAESSLASLASAGGSGRVQHLQVGPVATELLVDLGCRAEDLRGRANGSTGYHNGIRKQTPYCD